MKKMLKKIGLPVIALLGLLAVAPYQAKAAVRFGVVVAPRVCAPVRVIPRRVIVEHPYVRHAIRRDARYWR